MLYEAYTDLTHGNIRFKDLDAQQLLTYLMYKNKDLADKYIKDNNIVYDDLDVYDSQSPEWLNIFEIIKNKVLPTLKNEQEERKVMWNIYVGHIKMRKEKNDNI